MPDPNDITVEEYSNRRDWLSAGKVEATYVVPKPALWPSSNLYASYQEADGSRAGAVSTNGVPVYRLAFLNNQQITAVTRDRADHVPAALAVPVAPTAVPQSAPIVCKQQEQCDDWCPWYCVHCPCS